MTRSTDILKELEQISKAVAQISGETPYTLPHGYFETLGPVIMARIAAGGNEENSLLQIAGKQMPQDVPEGYFDTLPENILSKIKEQTGLSAAEELKELSPLLAGISKSNVYEVPDGYFETLSANKTRTSTSTVVTMYSRKVWLRYAAAAVVFAMIAFGISLFIKQPPTVNNPDTAAVYTPKTEQQINTELAQITDEEIISYLKLTADSKDAETMAALVDEEQLPDEAQYMDDAFLESFMKELEQPELKTN